MCIFYKIVLVFHLEGKSCVSPFLGALVMNNILFCPDMIPGAFLGFLTALFCFASGVGAWPFVFCSKRCLLLLTLQIQYVHLIIWSQVRLLGVWTDWVVADTQLDMYCCLIFFPTWPVVSCCFFGTGYPEPRVFFVFFWPKCESWVFRFCWSIALVYLQFHTFKESVRTSQYVFPLDFFFFCVSELAMVYRSLEPRA